MAEAENPHYHGSTGMPVYELLLASPRDEDVDLLLALKKTWAAARERTLQQQKAAGKEGDRDRARDLKETANHLMQLQRAACLFLGHVAAQPPGDSPWRPLRDWGRELAQACHTVDTLACQPELARRHIEMWREL